MISSSLKALVFAALTGWGLCSVPAVANETDLSVPKYTYGQLDSVSHLTVAIWRLFATHGIYEAQKQNFEKIDLSVSGDPLYGDNPEWEIFNPDGPARLSPLPQDYIDSITDKKSVRPVLNLRRAIRNGAEIQDTLYFTIPHISEIACERWHIRYSQRKAITKSAHQIEILQDSSVVIIDEFRLPTDGWCIQQPDETLLFMAHVAGRQAAHP